jgi:hypothetical protein
VIIYRINMIIIIKHKINKLKLIVLKNSQNYNKIYWIRKILFKKSIKYLKIESNKLYRLMKC